MHNYTANTCTHKHSPPPPLHRLLFSKRCLLFQSVSQLFSLSSTSQRRGPLNYTRRWGRSQWAGPRGRRNPLPLSLMISVSQLEIHWSAHRVSIVARIFFPRRNFFCQFHRQLSLANIFCSMLINEYREDIMVTLMII